MNPEDLVHKTSVNDIMRRLKHSLGQIEDSEFYSQEAAAERQFPFPLSKEQEKLINLEEMKKKSRESLT